MLRDSTVSVMVAVKDQAAGDLFFGGTLGLEQLGESSGGTMYKSGAGKMFVYESAFAGTNQATTAAWEVDDVAATVDELKAKGISFEHYDMSWLTWDGDVAAADDVKIAWFKDPDGNIFQVSSALES